MAGFFGNPVARNVRQGICKVNVSTWSPIHSGLTQGLDELPNRQWIKFQGRGQDNIRLAIKYVNKNADGTFTVPTSTAHDAIVYPSMAVLEEPISDSVRVYARAVQNGGSAGGFKVVCAEYS